MTKNSIGGRRREMSKSAMIHVWLPTAQRHTGDDVAPFCVGGSSRRIGKLRSGAGEDHHHSAASRYLSVNISSVLIHLRFAKIPLSVYFKTIDGKTVMC